MNLDEMAVHLAEVDSRSKSNTHRINELSTQIEAVNRLATAVEVMATEQRHQTTAMEEIKADVAKLDAKVETIEQKPAKRWDGMVEKIIYGFIGALVAAATTGLIALMAGAV